MAIRRVEHFSKTTHSQSDIQAYVNFTRKDHKVQSCDYADAGAEWVVTTVYK